MFDGYQKLRSLNKNGTLIQAEGPRGGRVHSSARRMARLRSRRRGRLERFQLEGIPRVSDSGDSFSGP